MITGGGPNGIPPTAPKNTYPIGTSKSWRQNNLTGIAIKTEAAPRKSIIKI